jgi:hypothetical protein
MNKNTILKIILAPWLGKAIWLHFSVVIKFKKRQLKPEQKVEYYKKGLLVGICVTGSISAGGTFEVRPWTSVIEVRSQTFWLVIKASGQKQH